MFFKPLLNKVPNASDFGALSIMIGDSIVIDAGTILTTMTRQEQLALTDIFITHVHLDHIKDLGFLADSIYSDYKRTISVHGSSQTVKAIREHVFNGKIWADFTKIPDQNEPVLAFKELDPKKTISVGAYTIRAIPVNHIPGTSGYVVSGAEGNLVVTGDTGPTEEIWEYSNGLNGEKTIYIETSFPNRLQKVADTTGHLTPETLKGELDKIKGDASINICHVKPPYYDEIIKEIKQIGDDRLKVLKQ